MPVFCIPRHISAKLKEAASKGEINIKTLYEMNSKQRNEFWKKYVNEETAQFINSGFEKSVLDEQQSSLQNWVKNTFDIKDKARQKNAIDKIGELSQSGALNPENAENFLSDLVANKLGITVSAEEAQKIDMLSRELNEEFNKPVDQYGLPNTSYFKKRQEMEKYLRSLTPSNQLKVFTSIIGRGSMLFSIKSPLVNIIGNTIQQTEQKFEKRISSNNYSGKVDKSLMNGYVKRSNEIYKETGYDVTRMNSYSDGMKILGEDIVHSEGAGPVRKVGRFYEDAVFKKLLSGPDVYFSSLSFADSANLGATLVAKEEGLTGQALKDRAGEIFRDATSVSPKTVQGEYLRETAIADALVATFQDETNYSKLALLIRSGFNMVSGDLRIGDQIMPFVKTPANVVGMTLDAGGIGAVKGFWKLPQAVKEMKGGDPSLMRQVAKEFTRAGLGMTAAFLLASLFDPDDFIGRYPTSKSEQELLTTKKARENSIRIAGKWVSLDYFGFLGGPLVGFLYAKKYGKDLPSAMYSYGSGVLIQSQNIPGFEAIKDLTTAIGQLKPEEGEGMADTLSKFKTSALDYLRSRTVPGFVYDIAKAMDASEREVDSKNPSEKFKSTIPGLRQTLKEKEDVFGAVIKGEPWWSVMLFGSRVQTARDSKVISEVDRLNEAGFIPALNRPEKSANSRASQLKEQIGPEKFNTAIQTFRDKYMVGVSKLIDSGSYKRMNDEDKKKAIDKVKDDSLEYMLKRFGYKKPKKTSEVPVETKKSAFNFKIVKEAFAAEGLNDLESLKNKMVWSKDDRSLFEKALGKLQEKLPGIQGSELPREGIVRDKLSTEQRKAYYDTMLTIREQDPDWYYQNIGNKVEKRILGHDLGTEKEVRPILESQKKVVEEAAKKPTEAPLPTGRAREGVGEAVVDDVTYSGLSQRKPDTSTDTIIKEETKDKQVNPSLVAALLWNESGYKPDARNENIDKETGKVKSTDRGIAQINDKAHPNVTDAQADDPKFAINFLVGGISKGLDKFDGDINKAIAAYNRGTGRVTRNGIDKLGQQYIDRVAKNLTKDERIRLGIKTTYDK